MLRSIVWIVLGTLVSIAAAYTACSAARLRDTSLKYYITQTEEVANRYELVGCCLAGETSATIGAKTLTYRRWACDASVVASQKRSLAQGNEGEGGDEPDYPIQVDAVAWHLDRIDEPTLPRDNLYAPFALPPLLQQRRVDVYIVDTGIDENHAAFNQVDVSMDYPSPSESVDCYGHGTAVASLVAANTVGVDATCLNSVECAVQVVLHSIRCLGCDGSGSTFDVLKALTWVSQNVINASRSIINLSLGSSKSNSIDSLVTSLVNDMGIAVVAAAGNENTDACNRSPAGAASVFTVAASKEDDSRASFSNWGQCVEIFAPGTNIPCANMGSGNGFVLYSGTSQATPITVGAMVRCMLQNDMTSLQAVQCAVNKSVTGVLSNIGSGSPNRLVNIASGTASLPATPTATPTLQPSPAPPLTNNHDAKGVPENFVFLVAIVVILLLF